MRDEISFPLPLCSKCNDEIDLFENGLCQACSSPLMERIADLESALNRDHGNAHAEIIRLKDHIKWLERENERLTKRNSKSFNPWCD